jgi:hypothetical protein
VTEGGGKTTGSDGTGVRLGSTPESGVDAGKQEESATNKMITNKKSRYMVVIIILAELAS